MKEINELKNVKFSEGCDKWLELKKNMVKESSYFCYKFNVEKHLKPDLGNVNLLELEDFDFNKYITEKKQKIKNGELKGVITNLKSILKYLKKCYGLKIDLDFYISKNKDTEEIEVFGKYEKQKLNKYLLDSKNIRDVGVLISLYAGLRIGEVCGLKWEDIDIEKKIISVKRTVQRVYVGKNRKSRLIVTTPKSRKSIRKIPISKFILNKLRKYSMLYPSDCFVLTGERSRFLEPLVYRYVYKKILKRCEIKYVKYHCLRHTFATRCVRVGMDVKSLSEVLGHSNVNVTLSVYVHSSMEVKKRFIDRI